MVNHPNRKKPAEVERDHAKENAKAWAESMAEMVAALEVDYDRLELLRDELAEVREGESMDAARNTGTLENWAAEAADTEGHTFQAAAAEYLDLHKGATIEGGIQTSRDDVEQRIQESPLSVEVRGGWCNPGAMNDAQTPEEFCILLSTGGPALRIMGELDQYCQPSRAWLEYQDWGTPWTQYFDVGQSTLLAFCQCFYFGE